MTAQYQIVMRSGPNAGRTYPLEVNEAVIGRDTANFISINDAEVSRKHAKLTRLDQGYAIEDLGSTNGTFINGQRIVARHALRPGDLISLGENITMNYEAVTDPNATMVSSPKAVSARAPKAAAAQPPPPPPPAYSGQVPAGPVPVEQPRKKRSPLLAIGLVIFLLLCLCGVLFWLVDFLNLYCTLLPFLFPGAC
ncbi:MAG: FHA domain-containing protein [Chloroflexi bacterium]|nr:FHA domain-containing protein [Chloroflexota bacterium]